MSIVSATLKGAAVVALVGGLGLAADILAGPQPAKSEAAPRTASPVPSTAATANTVASSDKIALALPHASAVSTPSQPNAWGGARTGQESTLSDRVVNYEIEAALDPVKHTVDGKQKLTWRNRSDRAIRSVYLHLYLNAFEGANSTFFSEQRQNGFGFRSEVPVKDGEWGHIELRKVAQSGAAVPWSFVHPDGGPVTDHTVVRLDLPAAVPAGGSTVLDIDFHDQLPRVIARTGYFGSFHLVGQWFPKIGVLELPGERGATEPRWNAHEFHMHSEFYADYGNFDMKLTVPKGYTVGATGEELGAPLENDGKLTHHFVQGDVHDFAWTADNRTAPPLEGVYRGAGSPEVKVRVLFPPEYQSNAAPVLKATLDSLAYFSQTLGPYPYKTVTAVIPPFNAGEAGGMEYPTFFTTVNADDATPGTLDSYLLDFVTIHEFGHGYFYGILGSNEFEEPMLDEGLNEYWDLRMIRDRGQQIGVTTKFLRSIGLGFNGSVFGMERIGASRSDPADGLGGNSWDRLSSNSYGTVYARTATAMRDLEQRLGKPVLEKAFKKYYATWKFRHPSVADFREVLAQESGQRALVESLFVQQVYKTQKLDDRVDSLTSVEELPQVGTIVSNGKWVEATKEQIEKRVETERDAWKKMHPKAEKGSGPFPYRTTVVLRRNGVAVPQTLVVKFTDGSRETVKWDSSSSDGDPRWQRYSWVKPVKAVSAELDPQHSHYLDANKLDDSRTIEADNKAARRWTSEIAAFGQILFSLISTL